MVGLSVPNEYVWVLGIVFLNCFLLQVQGMVAGSKRSRYFTKAFFEKEFPELKGKIPRGGYPDMGNGKYAQKLPLDAWVDFNNGQRAHYNFLEGIALICVSLMVSGLYYPILTTQLGAIYFVGRIFYGLGYVSSGPKGRTFGVLLCDVVLLALAGMSLRAVWVLGGGMNGFTTLLELPALPF